MPATILCEPAPVNPAVAVAVITSVALLVYGGGGPPEPCPLVGILQRAISTFCAQVEGGTGSGKVCVVNVALAFFPVFKELIKRLLVVLLKGPEVVGVTLTLMVHVPLAATVPFEKLSEVAPAVGANVGLPHPDVPALGVAATCKPAGSGSVKL